MTVTDIILSARLELACRTWMRRYHKGCAWLGYGPRAWNAFKALQWECAFRQKRFYLPPLVSQLAIEDCHFHLGPAYRDVHH